MGIPTNLKKSYVMVVTRRARHHGGGEPKVIVGFLPLVTQKKLANPWNPENTQPSAPLNVVWSN